MRRPSMLVCVRAAVLALPVVLACASKSNSNDSGNGTSSGNNGSGGNGGSNGGSGGNNGSGGSGNNGSGGGTAGSGGGSGGSGSNGSGGSTGGGTLADGGSTSTSPDSGKRVCEVNDPDVIADFEDDTATMVAQNGYTGIWYDFADTAAGAANPSLLIQQTTDTLPLVDGGVCNKYSLHTTGGLGTSGTDGYAGTRGDFLAHQVPAGSTTANTFPPPYSIPSSFSGIQFDVMVGAGGASSLTFEVVTQDTQPVPSGGTVSDASTPALFNNRGWMLIDNPSTTETNGTPISTTWQTVYIPFALLMPDFLPSGGACPTGVLCQAPAFDPTQALGIQFVENPGEVEGEEQNTSATASFDLWIDNVAFYTGSQGLVPPSMPNNIAPTFADSALGSCTKPTGATGKDLQWAYRNWYSRFVASAGGSALKVIRPENNNDTVSEGIGYGMLIAVAMDDPTLFAGLYQYWTQNLAVTGTGGLMTWNNTGGSGSATDADQDAAFALLQAGQKFSNATYTSDGTAMVANIWNHEIDPHSFLPTGGSNYTNGGVPDSQTSQAGNVTDPSYFAPEYYPTFGKVDTAHTWSEVATAVYTALNNVANSSTGLVPAWCTSSSDTTAGSCTAAGENTGGASDETYQYDSHRVPWRVGLDYCWNGNPSAASFLSKLINFFNGIGGPTGTGGGGVGRLWDQYELNGTMAPNAQPNSMSLIGCAGVGAMATGTTGFVNSAWQFVLDGSNRALLDVAASGSMSGYSYFNATVGLLTLLSMSGNINPP
ncbi:MAG TPA: glycosyl hydrolase family 8 [Polyangiaceae bacterium]|nr:glycosyl hydrolase family 8 [Polyangiaceae bacterium]